jgi:hypothetical protein
MFDMAAAGRSWMYTACAEAGDTCYPCKGRWIVSSWSSSMKHETWTLSRRVHAFHAGQTCKPVTDRTDLW